MKEIEKEKNEHDKKFKKKKDFVDIDKRDTLLYNPHIRRDPYGTWNGKFNKEAMT